MTCLQPALTANGPVPCGRCEACLVRKSNEWAFRLFQELEVSQNAYFVTLTYDEVNCPRGEVPVFEKTRALGRNELLSPFADKIRAKREEALNHYNLYGEWPVKYYLHDMRIFSKRDIQLFIKKLRKRIPLGFRYFLCSEYGALKERPHYHAIFFNLPILSPEPNINHDKITDLIRELWNKGKVDVQRVCNGNLIYTAKYSLSTLDYAWNYPKPFILASKGLGMNYVANKDNLNYHIDNLSGICTLSDGSKFPLPRYYKRKMFDDEIRQVYNEKCNQNIKEYTDAEKEHYKYKIRKNFKKSRKSIEND